MRFMRYLNLIFLGIQTIQFQSVLGAAPFDYIYDGETTYCFHINQPLTVSVPDESYIIAKGMNEDCTLEMKFAQLSVPPLYALKESLSYEYTAKLNLQDNVFGQTELYAVNILGSYSEIVHANVHACRASSICDVFTPKGDRYVSREEKSNFTDSTATFFQKLDYKKPGEYIAFAHVVLASSDENSTYHFMTGVNVGEVKTYVSPALKDVVTEESDSSLWVVITIGIGVLLIGLITVVWVLYTKPKSKDTNGDDYRFSVTQTNPMGKSSTKRSGTDHDVYYSSVPQQYSGSIGFYHKPMGMSSSGDFSSLNDPTMGMSKEDDSYSEYQSQIDVGDSVSQVGAQDADMYNQYQYQPELYLQESSADDQNHSFETESVPTSAYSSEISLGSTNQTFSTAIPTAYNRTIPGPKNAPISNIPQQRLSYDSSHKRSARDNSSFMTVGELETLPQRNSSQGRPSIPMTNETRAHGDVSSFILTNAPRSQTANNTPQQSFHTAVGMDSSLLRSTGMYDEQDLYEDESYGSDPQYLESSNASNSSHSGTMLGTNVSSNRSALYEY